MSETRTFALAESRRQFDSGGPGGLHERRFLDFIIDGGPLYDRIRTRFDLISPLWFDLEIAQHLSLTVAAGRLLGKDSSNLGGRTPIYICSLCGDLGCGALTVKIERRGQRVSWAEWGYQNDYEEKIWPVDELRLEELTFDLLEYETALSDGLHRLIQGGSG